MEEMGELVSEGKPRICGAVEAAESGLCWRESPTEGNSSIAFAIILKAPFSVTKGCVCAEWLVGWAPGCPQLPAELTSGFQVGK